MTTTENYILTHQGRLFNLSDPKAEDVSLMDLAHALAAIPRFTGHTFAPISVAQHSVLCDDLCKALMSGPGHATPAYFRAAVLFHDAHEAYINDFSTPMKNELERRGANGAYRSLVHDVQRAIDLRFGLPNHEAPGAMMVVHRVDLAALHLERARFMAKANDGPQWPKVEWMPDQGFSSDALREPWDRVRAQNEWMARAAQVGVSNVK